MRIYSFLLLVLFFLSSCEKQDLPGEVITSQEIVSVLGGSQNDVAQSAIATSDGGFAILGYTQSNNGTISDKSDNSFDFWLLKFNSNAEIEWNKTYGGSDDDRGRSLIQTSDGGYALLGYNTSTDGDASMNNGSRDFWLIKTDPNGNLIWEKTIGATDFDAARSVTKTHDNGFLISGSSRSSDNGFNNQGSNDALVVKVNADGILEWQKTVGGSEIDFLYDAIELNNKTIIAVGESSSTSGDILENKGFSDALIIKIK